MSARSDFLAKRLLAAVLWVLADPGWASSTDPCVAPSGSLSDYLSALSVNLNTPESVAGDLKNELASRANSDGLAGGRLDLLRRAFVALDLGQVQDEEGKLVFNFNPDALHLDSFGQFSPRVIIHEPTLYAALDKEIDTFDEAVRSSRRDQLKKSLGDLDDVELALRWTPKSQEPATDLQEVANLLYDQAIAATPTDLVDESANAKREIAAILAHPNPGAFGENITVVETCENPDARERFERVIGFLQTATTKANEEFESKLTNAGFFRLADLIEGEPRLVFSGAFRQRAGAAGPDESKLDVTWQRGWISYSGAKKFAGAGALDADTVNRYFEKYGRLEGALPLFSLVASYSDLRPFQTRIPDVTDEFSADGGHKISGKATAGRYFGGKLRDRRLELAATYDDVSDDPALQDRFVLELSWVEHLGDSVAQAVGGSEFVASLIWASKPEFRGEVDEELGLRAGLKWSLGKADKKVKTSVVD